jgi:cytochrome c oxidase assembly protein subunit 15
MFLGDKQDISNAMTRQYNPLYNGRDRLVSLWLCVVCAAIICMIFIGGLTRLTHSGLSITEWNPVSGILPPLNETDWQNEFDKYKESPEYLSYNLGMSLSDFKPLYLIEFTHRIAGRITGLIYIIPLIFFLITKRIRGMEIAIHALVTGLFALQGVMGWYMVKSGLLSSPHVSHYRLAMHLSLAIIMYGILFWQLMKNSFDILLMPDRQKIRPVKILLIASLAVLFIQIIFGAFVAGLNAGLVYNTFPYMGDSFIPHEIYFTPISTKSFEEPVFVQFLHRTTAYALGILLITTCFYLYKMNNIKLNKCAASIFCSFALQLLAGIITLIYALPITVALIHQLGAVLLLSTVLWGLFLINSVIPIQFQRSNIKNEARR